MNVLLPPLLKDFFFKSTKKRMTVTLLYFFGTLSWQRPDDKAAWQAGWRSGAAGVGLAPRTALSARAQLFL